MIACFPDPLPDELFYSVLARYRHLLGVSSGKLFSEHVFGSKNRIATVEFPSCLKEFVNRLPPNDNVSVNQIIDGHSFLPYFAPFIPAARTTELQQDMAGNNGKGIHFRTGLMASRIPVVQFLRFCPKCVSEDKDTFTECYWHRSHQAAGVTVCPIHHVELQESQVAPRQSISRQQYITLDEVLASSHLSLTYCHEKHKLQLSHDTAWLLTTNRMPIHPIKDIYKRRLFDLGYCSYDGRIISARKLIDTVRDHIPNKWLQEMKCEYLSMPGEWILSLVRNDNSSQHPLMHLIFMQFLGLSAEEVFSTVLPEPFGQPDWPCLNPVCQYYKSDAISAVTILRSKYTSGLPIGEFSCQCGFTYRRKGPDTTQDDRLRAEKVTAFGKLWEERLKVLWKTPRISVREIGRVLGADSITVKRHAKRVGLPFPRKGPRTSNLKPRAAKGQKQKSPAGGYRRIWLQLMSRNPGVGIKGLRTLDAKTYTWLYRYDANWLANHKPISRSTSVSKKRPKVNWKKRDKALADLIQEMFEKQTHPQSKPIRITTSYIGRTIGKLALLEKHLDKLPMTAQVLQRLIETPMDYAVRRIHWAFEILSKNGGVPKRWQVIRTAGVSRSLLEPKIIEALNLLHLENA